MDILDYTPEELEMLKTLMLSDSGDLSSVEEAWRSLARKMLTRRVRLEILLRKNYAGLPEAVKDTLNTEYKKTNKLEQ